MKIDRGLHQNFWGIIWVWVQPELWVWAIEAKYCFCTQLLVLNIFIWVCAWHIHCDKSKNCMKQALLTTQINIPDHSTNLLRYPLSGYSNFEQWGITPWSSDTKFDNPTQARSLAEIQWSCFWACLPQWWCEISTWQSQKRGTSIYPRKWAAR